MKYRLKKLAALLMALLMVLSSSPVSAFAENGDEYVTETEGQGFGAAAESLQINFSFAPDITDEDLANVYLVVHQSGVYVESWGGSYTGETAETRKVSKNTTSITIDSFHYINGASDGPINYNPGYETDIYLAKNESSDYYNRSSEIFL